MDIVSFILGVIVGVVVVGFAIELGLRRFNRHAPSTQPTHKWTLGEIKNPRIIAETMGAVSLPTNAKIVVNEYPNKAMFKGMAVKHHSGIKGNFIIGDDRALILSGPIQEEELGLWTVEKETLQKLSRYFEDSWEKGTSLFDDETTQ